MAINTDRGSFLPISPIVDPGFIQKMDVNGREFKELIVELRKAIREVITVLNKKTTGRHELTEFVTGSTYFSDPTLNSTTPRFPTPRQEFLITVNFGALPNTASKSVAHGIIFPSPNTLKFVHIHATANDLTAPAALEIPYSSPVLVNNIAIDVDGTNVTITTGSDRTAFTECYVVLKYIKD